MKLKLLLITIALFVGCGSWGQIAAWDFTAENTGTATSLAEVYNANLDAQNLITRGSGAAPSSANDSFRSTGFQNNGIATSNTNYFQITLSASTGNILSLSTIDARFAGTATFCASPGVSNQFAYSLDGSTFTLISSAQLLIGTPVSLTQINLSGIAALQNVAATTTITLRYYASGQTTTGGWGFNSPSSGQYGLAIGGTVSAAGITSTKSGPWSDPATWVGNVVPTSSQNAIIAHNVTTGAITRDSGTTTTINTGASLAVSGTYTNDGTTTVNGTFQIDQGGFGSGTGTYTYGGASTLAYNHTSGVYGSIDSFHVYWPATNSPFNVSVLNSGSGGINLGVARTVAGIFSTSANIDNPGNLTINGTLLLNAGYNFSGTGNPIYGSSSLLRYNSGGTPGRNYEWTASSGTVGTTPGFPNNVQLSNNTVLNYPNTSSTTRSINGNLTIDTGSALYMDYSGGSAALIVGKDVINNGSLSLGSVGGGDLTVGGKFTNNGTFTHKTRAVFFSGTSLQTISGSFNTAGTTNNLPFVYISNSNNVTIASNVLINNNLTLTSGKFILGTSNLTLSSGATISAPTATNYVQTSSTGRLIQNVGASNVFYPVGRSSYNPITINNAGTADDYGIYVVDAVTTPASNNSTKLVNRFWNINEANAGGNNLAITTQWNSPSEENVSFAAGTTSRIGLNDSAWTVQNATLGTGTVGGSATFTSSTNFTPANITTGATIGAGKDDAFIAAPPTINASGGVVASAPGSGTSGYVGNTITINGTNLNSVTIVKVGGVGGTTVTITGQTATTLTFVAINLSGTIYVQNPGGNATSTESYTNLGYITSSAGAINIALRWLGGSVPLANSTVTIAHAMTHSTGTATTFTPFESLTIPSGGSLAVSAGSTVTVTNAITTTGSGSLSLAGSATVSAGSVSNAGTISWTTGTLTINSGGTLTNTGNFNGGSGNVNFAGAGTINGSAPIAFNNLTINGTTTLTTVPTINGTLQINSGGNVTAAPTYGSASTLVYNTTGIYAVSNEWTGNGTAAASGIPQNVTIQNNTTLTMPNTNRGLAGSLNINSGNLTLNAVSGDLYLTGNWTRASTAFFTPNNRAVFFNGSSPQTVTVSASGTETFNYLFVAGSGTLRPATGTAINVTASSGLSLSSTHATSTIDLNGQTLTLSGGGNLNLNTGNRFITSSAANGKLVITSNTITVINGGTLTTSATNTTIDLQNGLDCGTGSLVTINGTLQINANGFCVGNSPKYGSSSLLHYNSGVNPYNRQLEWTGNGTTAGIGIPQNVQISNNTTLNYINAGNSGAKGIAGNLTIDSGSSLIMNYGSVTSGGPLTVSGNLSNAGNLTLGHSSGDDLKLSGNFNNTGSFNGNNRAIYFIKNGTQTVSSAAVLNIPYVVFQPTTGSTIVQLLSDLTVSAPLAGNAISYSSTTDVFDLNNKTLTIGTAGVANTIFGSGTLKGSTTSNLTLLGTGSIGTLNFTTGSQVLGNLTLNRQASNIGFDLGTGLTINGTLALTNGIANLSNQTMIITLAGIISGPSSSNYIIADFTAGGLLRKNFNANGSFTFPIGDRVVSADGTQYSPATINFTAAAYSSGWAALAVEDSNEPNIDAPTDIISRYWNLTSSGISSATYNFTGTYLPSDISGIETNCKSGRYSTSNSTWTDGVNLVSGANTILLTGLTSASGALTSPNNFTASYRNREINIKGLTGGTNNIVSGSPTANGLNNTLFAATNLGSSVTKDYEIQNLGIAALNLTGTPLVSIGGANPGDFAVNTVPATPIIGGSSTSFSITFSPTYAGIRTAIVSIANNDSDENPYTFLIQGTGICPTITNTITPTSGPVGTEITINSAADLTGATVTISGIATTVIPVSANQIKVLVPTGTTSGNLITTIVATGCQATNYFTVVNNLNTSCQGGNGASDLFISEVTDANWGGLTYVEIYNGTGVSKSLSGYSINTASNGNAYSATPLNLSNVTLASGSTYVVAFGDDNLCTSLGGDGSLAVQSTGNLGVNFKPNENDHIALFNGATKIDSWGTFGSDNWATSSLSIFAIETNGATFRRKNTALTLPSTTYANADWEIIDYIGDTNADCGNNDYSDIGTYNFISGTPPTVTTHPSYTPTCKATSLTVVGTEGYNGTSPADSKELTYRWLFSAPNETGWNEITSDGGIYKGTTTATLNISNIATVLNYQYYCQIRENTNTCYAASNAVKITDGGTTTWNGSWTNGAPTLDKLTIISEDYNTSSVGLGSFSACSVVVNSGKTLTITENEYVKIQNDLTNNGTVTIKNNGSLVQVNDDGVNTGNIRYERTTPLVTNTDYTYWSSPVADYTLGGVSQNLTVADKYYSFNSTIDDWEQKSASTTMKPGIGYIIRGPEPTGPNPPAPDNFDAFFIGVPNNGAYPISGLVVDKSYLLGNPYPSALDADSFLDDNAGVLNGTLYFWTHNTPLDLATNISNPGPNWAYAYSFDDYAAYNITGGVGIDPGTVTESAPSDPAHSVSGNDLGKKPTGKIASGQGFFATTKALLSGSTIEFNNSMRVGVVDILKEDNTQFFKTRNPKTKTTTFEKHRIWLNLTNTQGAFKQTLVGYITDATNEYDSRFDGESFDGNEFVDFYSINQEKNLVIQGRALPFDEKDEVQLGFRTTITGAFTIKIDQADGILTNQAVFIEDKLTNTTFDLRSGPFTFNTVAGTFNDRFILRYTNKTLGTKDLETLENQVLVSNKNKQIKINSKAETIDKVAVYDLLGRLLFKKDKVNNAEFSILNLISNSETLLVKVTLQNGETVTRKILY